MIEKIIKRNLLPFWITFILFGMVWSAIDYLPEGDPAIDFVSGIFFALLFILMYSVILVFGNIIFLFSIRSKRFDLLFNFGWTFPVFTSLICSIITYNIVNEITSNIFEIFFITVFIVFIVAHILFLFFKMIKNRINQPTSPSK